MIVIRRMLLLGLSLGFSIGLLGCTTKTLPIHSQDSTLDLLVQCEREFIQGKTDRAIETASEAIRLSPNRAEVWNARGFVYASQDSMGRAIEDFMKAVELNPTNATYQSNLGNAYLESGRS